MNEYVGVIESWVCCAPGGPVLDSTVLSRFPRFVGNACTLLDLCIVYTLLRMRV